MSLDQLPLLQVPYLVIDVETTGLTVDRDRIVEVAAVLVAPGEEPRVLLDSIVDPEGPIGASDVHGLQAADVVGAPTIRDLASALHSMMADRERLKIDDEALRALHARIFATALQRFTEDRRLDRNEQLHLQKLHACLRTLGWAPGD